MRMTSRGLYDAISLPRAFAMGMNPVYTPVRKMMTPIPAITTPSTVSATAVQEYLRKILWKIMKNTMSGTRAIRTLTVLDPSSPRRTS